MCPQVVEAKIPQAVLGVEGEDARINSKCALPFPSLVPVPPLTSFRPPASPRRMIKDDRVAHEDKRGAFARNQDVSDKVDMPLAIGKDGRSLALDDPDDDWTM